MRSTTRSTLLTGSALLKFNPQILWRKAFRDAPSAADVLATKDETVLPTSNSLIHTRAIYLSEPDDVRRCIERLLPNQVFNLVLTDKSV